MQRLLQLKIANSLGIKLRALWSRLRPSDSPKEAGVFDILRFLESRNIAVEKSDGFCFEYPIGGKKYRFQVADGDSDGGVFSQVILEQEYAYVVKVARRLHINVDRIIDAGANVGFTSLYFAHYFPTAAILAFEPNPSTYSRLVRNIKINELKSVTPIEEGIWKRKGFLRPDNTFRERWPRKTEPGG